MNRRSFFAVLASIPGFGFLAHETRSEESAEPQNPQNLPVVEFDEKGRICNLAELDSALDEGEMVCRSPRWMLNKSKTTVWIKRESNYFSSLFHGKLTIYYGEMLLYRTISVERLIRPKRHNEPPLDTYVRYELIPFSKTHEDFNQGGHKEAIFVDKDIQNIPVQSVRKMVDKLTIAVTS